MKINNYTNMSWVIKRIKTSPQWESGRDKASEKLKYILQRKRNNIPKMPLSKPLLHQLH